MGRAMGQFWGQPGAADPRKPTGLQLPHSPAKDPSRCIPALNL